MSQAADDKALLALIRWMDAFACVGASRFAPAPSTARWHEYSEQERAVARLAARDFMAALEADRRKAGGQ